MGDVGVEKGVGAAVFDRGAEPDGAGGLPGRRYVWVVSWVERVMWD